MTWPCMAANGPGSLLGITDVTAVTCSEMNSKLYRAILSVQSHPNATKQMDNDPNHQKSTSKHYEVKIK